MKRFSEQLKKKSDSIRLRANERADLRKRLESYIEYHPLPAELKTFKKSTTTNSAKISGIISEPFKTISWNVTYIRGFVGVFVVFIVVGVPVLAERSVPGDILYPVKTNITEEVRASLTLSPYAKVEWETKRLERRVAEARLLAHEGKLTPETEATVAQAVQSHTDAVTQEIALMRQTNEDQAAIAEITFASALSVQANVLQGYAEETKDTSNKEDGVEAEDVGHSITALTDVVNSVSSEANAAQAGAKPSYEALLGSVEAETTRAYELFHTIQNRILPEELADVERRLADVERKIVEAIVLHDNASEQNEQTQQYQDEQLVSQENILPASEDVSEEAVATTSTEGVTDTTYQEGEIPSEENTDTLSQEEGNNGNSTSTQEDVQPSTQIQESQEVVASTQEQQTEQAILLLRTALQDIQKLIIFMNDLDIRKNTTVEKLVPVTLTDEERIQNVTNQLSYIIDVKEFTEPIATSSVNTEKVSHGLKQLETYINEIEQALIQNALNTAERIVPDAFALAQDIEKLVQVPLKEEVSEEQEVDTLKTSSLEEKNEENNNNEQTTSISDEQETSDVTPPEMKLQPERGTSTE